VKDGSLPDPTGARRWGVTDVAARLDTMAARLRDDSRPTTTAIVEAAIELIPGARWATITVQEGPGFKSLVVSDELAQRLDDLQYDLNIGPCLDAIRDKRPYHIPDLRTDDRWPAYSAGAEALGVRSIFAQPLHLIDAAHTIASLNMYADREGAFTESWDSDQAVVLATFASMGTSVAVSRERAEQLEAALRTNREIAMAIGVLMGRHMITRETALNLLRLASQHLNLKMSVIADRVVTTGELPFQPSA